MNIRSTGAVMAAALFLAGCQTPGAGTQAAMAGAGAMATPAAYAPIQSSQPNDGTKSCDELLAEISEKEQIAASAALSESNAAKVSGWTPQSTLLMSAPYSSSRRAMST